MQTRIQHAVIIVTILLVTHIAVAQTHDIPEHGLRVELPRGWRRMEALSGNTILKMERTDSPGKQARIVIVTSLMEEPVDLSTVSREDHIRALESGSILGEKVFVLNVGRTQVAGIDALWGKAYRNLPTRGSTYEYTYEFFREYKAIPKGFTIRLTSYGDDTWFQSNAAAFDLFIGSITFNQQPRVTTPIASRILTRNDFPLTRNAPPHREGPQVRIAKGDPFWLALIKGFGKTFLLILLATIAVGIGKWIYSKYVVSQNPNRDDDSGAG